MDEKDMEEEGKDREEEEWERLFLEQSLHFELEE
jgi:hypothetical protein